MTRLFDRPRFIALALCLALAAAVPAHADWDDDDDERPRFKKRDQEIVWEARQRGEILPLEVILATVQRQYPGEFLKIELEDDDDELIYEIDLLTRRGIVLEIEIDARTGQILDVEEDD